MFDLSNFHQVSHSNFFSNYLSFLFGQVQDFFIVALAHSLDLLQKHFLPGLSRSGEIHAAAFTAVDP